MDHLERLQNNLRQLVFGLVILDNIILLVCWWIATENRHTITPIMVCGGLMLSFALSLAIMLIVTNYALQPLRAIWKLILHLSPSEHGTPAPNLDDLHFGRELVTSLAAQVYQLSDVAAKAAAEGHEEAIDLTRNFIAENMPLPLIVLDGEENIKFSNEAAAQYLGLKTADMQGKNAYMVLDMSFPSPETFDSWLKEVKVKKATATSSWERVRLTVRDGHPERLFDLAAYYNRDNPEHNETMLILFDHSKMYSQDEQAISFIALSVHELRTPLTLLRGYIEVFEEEIDTKGDPELADFMDKMRSQSEQLMAFVNNILNVARVDDDQLELHLEEAQWNDVVKQAVNALSLRAKVRGISLQCHLSTDLPSVGVDRISIIEVINNLVDNAIKYSGNSKVIEIETKATPEGQIETTVRDHGVGVPTSVLPNLFTKFYRDHRNRAQIGGTGLGLYLSKAIIDAHGGQLWVRSKEGEGSTFGFTLIPYAKLADDAKKSGDTELVRGAHGWIKNHSLYRR